MLLHTYHIYHLDKEKARKKSEHKCCIIFVFFLKKKITTRTNKNSHCPNNSLLCMLSIVGVFKVASMPTADTWTCLVVYAVTTTIPIACRSNKKCSSLFIVQFGQKPPQFTPNPSSDRQPTPARLLHCPSLSTPYCQYQTTAQLYARKQTKKNQKNVHTSAIVLAATVQHVVCHQHSICRHR